jgi:hypothetical protein
MPVALLAPVPLVHLKAGLDVYQKEGKVAFGSDNARLFEKLEEERGQQSVEVYILATKSDAAEEAVNRCWRARYVRCKPSINGEHPDGKKYRPETTEGEKWDVFWEVEQLMEAPNNEQFAISDFCGWNKAQSYKNSFVPRGPLLVKPPKTLFPARKRAGCHRTSPVNRANDLDWEFSAPFTGLVLDRQVVYGLGQANMR